MGSNFVANNFDPRTPLFDAQGLTRYGTTFLQSLATGADLQQRINDVSVNLRNFGATSPARPINSAIDKAAAELTQRGGGTLLIPDGDWLIDNSSAPYSPPYGITGVAIKGGPNARFLGTSLNYGVLRCGAETRYPYASNPFIPGASAGTKMRIEGLRIGYVGQPVTRLPGAALEIWNADDWTLRDVTIDGSPMMGIFIGFSKNMRVFNSALKYTRSDGLHFSNCWNSIIDGVMPFQAGEVGDDVFTYQRNDTVGGTPSVLTGVNTTTGVLTAPAHGRVNGQLVWIGSLNSSEQYQAPPAGLTSLTDYYVINATANTFQLSLTKGGPAVIPTGVGAGVVFIGDPLLVGQVSVSGLNVSDSLASGFSIIGAVDGAQIIAPQVRGTYAAGGRVSQDSYGYGAAKNVQIIGGQIIGAGTYSNPYQGVYSFEPWGLGIESVDNTIQQDVEVIGLTVSGSFGPAVYVSQGQHNVRLKSCTLVGGGAANAGSAQLLALTSGTLEVSDTSFDTANDAAIYAGSALLVRGKGNILRNACVNPRLLAAGAGSGTPGATNPVYNYATTSAMRATVGQIVDVWTTAGVLVGVGLTVAAIDTTGHTITLTGSVTGQSNTDLIAIAATRANIATGAGTGTPAATNPVYNYATIAAGAYVAQPVAVLNAAGTLLKGTGVVAAIDTVGHTITLTGTFTGAANTDLIVNNTTPVTMSLYRALWFGAQQVQDFGCDLIDDQAIATSRTFFLDSTCNRASYDLEAYLNDGTLFAVSGSPLPNGNNTTGVLRQLGDTQAVGSYSQTVGRRVSDKSAMKITLGATVPGATHELIAAIVRDEARMYLQSIIQGEGYTPIELNPSGGHSKIWFGDTAGSTGYMQIVRNALAVGGSDQVFGIIAAFTAGAMTAIKMQALRGGVGYPPIILQADGGVVRMGSNQRIAGVAAQATSAAGPFLTSEISTTLMGDGSLIVDDANVYATGAGALYLCFGGAKYRVLTAADIASTVAKHTHVHSYTAPATGTAANTGTDV